MGELWFRIKRFYRWEERELRDIVITVLAVAFIFGYDDKRPVFELIPWLLNYLKTLAIVAASFLAYDGAMKVAALHQGFTAEYRMWPQGLGMSIIITLLTKGKFPVILAGGLFLHHNMILRLGKFRYGLNTIAYGTIAAAGPIAHLVLMTLCLAMSKQLGIFPEFFLYAAVINGWMLFYQLLPIPKLNGIHIFFMSRLAYSFIAGTLMAYVILAIIGIYSWILSILIGTAGWLSWYWWVEGGKG